MNLKGKLKENRKTGGICAAVTVLLGLFLIIPRGDKPPVGIGLIRLSYDIPLLLRSSISISNENALIIFMDETSRDTLKQDPLKPEWERGTRIPFDEAVEIAHAAKGETNTADAP